MKVLFVCAVNIGRSQLAKGFYNLLTQSNDADSAGTKVEDDQALSLNEILAKAKNAASSPISLLKEKGANLSDSPRQKITKSHLAKDRYDLIVNIAEKGQTPDWLRGEHVIWWNIKDPGPHTTEAFMRETADKIEERVKKLIEIEKTGGDFHEIDDNIDEENA